jgi:hypothetical protein
VGEGGEFCSLPEVGETVGLVEGAALGNVALSFVISAVDVWRVATVKSKSVDGGVFALHDDFREEIFPS